MEDEDDLAPSIDDAVGAPPKRTLDDYHFAVRESLDQLKRIVCDGRSQGDLAKLMSRFAQRQISPVLLNHWLLGRYPMPPWAIEALDATAAKSADFLRRRADIIDGSIRPRIAAQVALIEPDEEPEEDLGPMPGM